MGGRSTRVGNKLLFKDGITHLLPICSTHSILFMGSHSIESRTIHLPSLSCMISVASEPAALLKRPKVLFAIGNIIGRYVNYSLHYLDICSEVQRFCKNP